MQNDSIFIRPSHIFVKVDMSRAYEVFSYRETNLKLNLSKGYLPERMMRTQITVDSINSQMAWECVSTEQYLFLLYSFNAFM